MGVRKKRAEWRRGELYIVYHNTIEDKVLKEKEFVDFEFLVIHESFLKIFGVSSIEISLRVTLHNFLRYFPANT